MEVTEFTFERVHPKKVTSRIALPEVLVDVEHAYINKYKNIYIYDTYPQHGYRFFSQQEEMHTHRHQQTIRPLFACKTHPPIFYMAI